MRRSSAAKPSVSSQQYSMICRRSSGVYGSPRMTNLIIAGFSITSDHDRPYSRMAPGKFLPPVTEKFVVSQRNSASRSRIVSGMDQSRAR
jgi:hypothetical protein